MTAIELINAPLLDAASEAAHASARKRRNHNFHRDSADSCQRLLNAIEPGSYVQPHCHSDPSKDETMVMIRGSMGLIVFDRDGRELGRHVLSAGEDCVGVNLPCGTWHTVFALEPGTVFIEAKAGPYLPLADTERAPWAPAEGTPEAQRLLEGWLASFAADRDAASPGKDERSN
jgi:cupin fold WbuC family metalloprotein